MNNLETTQYINHGTHFTQGATCLRLWPIGIVFIILGIAAVIHLTVDSPEKDDNIEVPTLTVELANHSWGLQAEITVNSLGDNGWTWDNPLFDPSIIHFRMNTARPEICRGFGSGIGWSTDTNRIYWNITDSYRCDACLYGVYAAVTNGSCWIVAKIMEDSRSDSRDLPVDTSLDFSLKFRNGSLVVYVQSPKGELPEIDELCIETRGLSWGGQDVGSFGVSTRVLYRNDTTLWCDPSHKMFGQEPYIGGLNASVLWFCRALGKDKTIYWQPITWTHFGDPPPIFTQPQDWH